jgi:uncharacterized protein (TIGR02246 family)
MAMRGLLLASVLSLISAPGIAAPLTKSDRVELTSLPAKFTGGWLHSSRIEVMRLFASDAVFIPHDGVKPHIGKAAIEQFWFPVTGSAGKVTAFTKTVDGLSGDDRNAIIWGKSDLHWQDDKTAYHWPGYYLMAVERRSGKWLITHLMSSDEQPTNQPVKTP